MTPHEMRKQTVAQLRKTFLAMMSPEWDIALEGKSQAEVTKAAKTLLAVQRARLRLGNAELADIRDKLKQNEEDLDEGRQTLDRALGNLQRVKRVLEATAAFLKIVARVVAMA